MAVRPGVEMPVTCSAEADGALLNVTVIRIVRPAATVTI